MSKIISNLLFGFIIQSQLVHAQNMCEKVDFNRGTSDLREFGPCVGESFIVLKINSYSGTDIEPFRPTSEFHLSATGTGISCLRSTTIFTLDNNSEIRTAIFLSWDVIGAWVEVQILDGDGEVVDVVARVEESNGWVSFYAKLNRSIENAQIAIQANINVGSTLAIEYLYVLNSDLVDDECIDVDTEVPVTEEPTDTPTDEPTEQTTDEPATAPTDEPTEEEPTEEPTDETTSESTDASTTAFTDEPTEDPSMTISQSSVYVWMSLSILFFITTVATLAGLYHLIWLYRKVVRTRTITNVSMKNLPRLIVKDSENGSVIVGMEKH